MKAKWILIGCFAASGGLIGCAPQIARGLPIDGATGHSAFEQRIQERYPPGSSELELRNTLTRQGFRISNIEWPAIQNPEGWEFSANRSVTFATLVCDSSWSVFWTAENGLISKIGGSSDSACL